VKLTAGMEDVCSIVHNTEC